MTLEKTNRRRRRSELCWVFEDEGVEDEEREKSQPPRYQKSHYRQKKKTKKRLKKGRGAFSSKERERKQRERWTREKKKIKSFSCQDRAGAGRFKVDSRVKFCVKRRRDRWRRSSGCRLFGFSGWFFCKLALMFVVYVHSTPCVFLRGRYGEEEGERGGGGEKEAEAKRKKRNSAPCFVLYQDSSCLRSVLLDSSVEVGVHSFVVLSRHMQTFNVMNARQLIWGVCTPEKSVQ